MSILRNPWQSNLHKTQDTSDLTPSQFSSYLLPIVPLPSAHSHSFLQQYYLNFPQSFLGTHSPLNFYNLLCSLLRLNLIFSGSGSQITFSTKAPFIPWIEWVLVTLCQAAIYRYFYPLQNNYHTVIKAYLLFNLRQLTCNLLEAKNSIFLIVVLPSLRTDII